MISWASNCSRVAARTAAPIIIGAIQLSERPADALPRAIVEVVEMDNPVALPRAISRVALNLPPLTDPDEMAERQRILDALEANVWSQTRAAAALKMSRRTLISKLDRYGIPRPQKGQREEGGRRGEWGRATGTAVRIQRHLTPGAPKSSGRVSD